MPTLDVSRMVLLTQREKQKFQDMANSAFNRILSGLVPPSSQQEYEFMKRDPWAYVTSRVKQLPTREEQAEIIQKATEAMPIAFHGSPHKFEKFDVSKVGTGQGAQSYGHGLYFAENPEVAKSYSPAFSGRTEHAQKMLQNIAQRRAAGGESPEHLTRTEQYWKDELQAAGKSSMYQVNIPDEHVAKMLDWDKPLSEQAPEVRKVLIEAGLIADKSKFSDAQIYARAKQYFEGPRSMAHVREDIGMAERVREGYKVFQEGPQAFRKWLEMQPSGSSVVQGMIGPGPAAEYMSPAQLYSKIAATPAEASEKLKQLGIPGIKYLDQGSRQAGQGTRNFVIFDPKILKDVKRMTE